MKKHVHISVPIYKSWVYVVSDIDECIKLSACKTGMRLTTDDFDGNGMTISGWMRNIVWLPEGADFDTIAHECTHVVLNIFKTKGVEVDTDNQEPTAYLMGYITHQVIKAHNKLKEQNNG